LFFQLGKNTIYTFIPKGIAQILRMPLKGDRGILFEHLTREEKIEVFQENLTKAKVLDGWDLIYIPCKPLATFLIIINQHFFCVP